MDLKIRNFVICPGGRNAPFVEVLEKLESLGACALWTHFEERSAAFFALGLCRRLGASVAIITTSGTASAELLPAAIEAHYQGLPLVFVTADRPRKYRTHGTPQTIDQVNLFGKYVSACLDIDAIDSLFPLDIRIENQGIHLNVCLDDPLVLSAPELQTVVEEIFSDFSPPVKTETTTRQSSSFSLKNYAEPVFLISGLTSAQQECWQVTLRDIDCPQFFESTSGLYSSRAISEQTLIHHLKNGDIRSIIRIGGTPTCRLWRDLEDGYPEVEVCSLATGMYPGLARSKHDFYNIFEGAMDGRSLWRLRNTNTVKILKTEKIFSFELQKLYEAFPQAEQTLFWLLSQEIQIDPVYLGNSLPIRRYDQFAERNSQAQDVYANRGANGIDGQLSSYLGWSVGLSRSWCVLGDLTLLYDFAGFWSLKAMPMAARNIVVINNRGGKIFETMFSSTLFMNEHNLHFSKIAEFWRIDYRFIQTSDDLAQLESKNQGTRLIEIMPNDEQTKSFRSELARVRF